MATVIPVDEFISDEWYPGFKPGYTHAPWYVDPVQTFRKEDEENFWFLDFHWPRGLTPMGLIWNEDGYNWASQLAAEQMPLPPGRGITCRLGGTHTYGSAIPVNDPREIGQRAKRLEHSLPPFLQNFDTIWGRMREEVNESWDYFRGMDLSRLSLEDLRENSSRPASTTSAPSRSTSRSCTRCSRTTSASTACAQNPAWTHSALASRLHPEPRSFVSLGRYNDQDCRTILMPPLPGPGWRELRGGRHQPARSPGPTPRPPPRRRYPPAHRGRGGRGRGP
jgi:hypothetical protein